MFNWTVMDIDTLLVRNYYRPSLFCSGEIKDPFTKFRQLRRRSTVTSTAPLKAADGSLLSNQLSVVTRWKEHFCNLLNCPLHDSPDVLVAEAEAAIPDADIDTHPPTILETYRAEGEDQSRKSSRCMWHIPGVHLEVIRLCRHLTSSSSRCGKRKLSQMNGTKGS